MQQLLCPQVCAFGIPSGLYSIRLVPTSGSPPMEEQQKYDKLQQSRISCVWRFQGKCLIILSRTFIPCKKPLWFSRRKLREDRFRTQINRHGSAENLLQALFFLSWSAQWLLRFCGFSLQVLVETKSLITLHVIWTAVAASTEDLTRPPQRALAQSIWTDNPNRFPRSRVVLNEQNVSSIC